MERRVMPHPDDEPEGTIADAEAHRPHEHNEHGEYGFGPGSPHNDQIEDRQTHWAAHCFPRTECGIALPVL
jgi:hypothetical protein